MRLFNSFIYPFTILCILWIITIYQQVAGADLSHFGVYPRHISGLEGILTMPFVHAGFPHLMANSLPFLVLGFGIIYFYPEVAFRVYILIYLLTGALVWCVARDYGVTPGGFTVPTRHIGISGIIYGFAAFLLFEGLFRRNIRLMAISLLVLIYYGGMFWGALPGSNPQISWEGHACGAASGIFVAYLFRKKGPSRKKYDWENEDEGPDDRPHISHYYEVKP